MNDERLRWALEQIEGQRFAIPITDNAIAAWALEHPVRASVTERLDREYAATFKLPKDRSR